MPFSMFNQLMYLTRESFSQKYFDTAYHTLAAALHLAIKKKYKLGLKEVESVATDLATWIDLNPMEYRYSSEDAPEHERRRVFEGLARKARLEHVILAQGYKDTHDALEKE